MADCNLCVVRAAQVLLDFMHLAHLGSMMDDDLDVMEDALRTFHNHKEVFLELGAISTNKGFHGIPKIHMISHYIHLIQELGTPDGYNTKTLEQLHIDFTKLGYCASNKVNATKQMALYIQWLEAIEMHATYLSELEEDAGHAQDHESGLESSCPAVEMPVERERVCGLDDSYNEEDEWDVWYKEEDKEDDVDELTDAGVTVKPIVAVGIGRVATRVEGRPWEEKAQPPGAEGSDISTMFYPNPQHVVAQTPTATATVSELVLGHGAERFLDAIQSFVTKELQMDFNNATRLNIWSRARLFHSPPPFQPSKGLHIEVVRVQLAKIDQYGRISRPR